MVVLIYTLMTHVKSYLFLIKSVRIWPSRRSRILSTFNFCIISADISQQILRHIIFNTRIGTKKLNFLVQGNKIQSQIPSKTERTRFFFSIFLSNDYGIVFIWTPGMLGEHCCHFLACWKMLVPLAVRNPSRDSNGQCRNIPRANFEFGHIVSWKTNVEIGMLHRLHFSEQTAYDVGNNPKCFTELCVTSWAMG